MRNPFRRQKDEQPEKRLLDVGSMHFPMIDDSSDALINGSVGGAIRLAPVFAAGRLLASNVASMPLQVYRRTGDERLKLPLPSLFVKPSAVGTLHDWIFRAMTSLVYRGNAVGLIMSTDQLEYPTEIEWLNPDLVYVTDSILQLGERGSYTNPIWYYNGTEIPASSLVHIPWFTMPGSVWGLSPMGAYAASVQTGLAAQKFSADWFKNGGVPPGTFQNANQTVEQDQATLIKQRLVSAIRSREPIVYGKDWTYTPISVSANEAQFVDTMRLTASQIASIYGLPPEYLGGEVGGSLTYSSPEQRQIEFVQMALLPWLAKLEDALSALLPRGQYVKFNVDALIRSDAAIRYANYERARLIGMMNLDEIRALEDMSPLPNGQGQDYSPMQLKTIPGASTPTNKVPGSTAASAEPADEARAVGTGMPPQLVKYWVHGAGAQKIRWGVDGDFDRCVVNIQSEVSKDGKPLPEHEVHGLCSTLHKMATGASPGHAPGEGHS